MTTKKTKWAELRIGITNNIKKHWWRWAIVLLAGGLAFSGFKCEWGDKKFIKESVEPWKTKAEVKK